MIAYKFLASGAVSPFTGYRWPVPASEGCGAWVDAPDERTEHGIHACRVSDLAFWLDAELWRVELAEPVVAAQRQIVGKRARLLSRVTRWDDETARNFAEECLWRARDRAVASLRRAALDDPARVLAGPSRLAELRSVSRALAPQGGLAAALVGYLAEAVDFLDAGDAACSAYISARSAVVAEDGDEDAFGLAREEQGSALADRLGLSPQREP